MLDNDRFYDPVKIVAMYRDVRDFHTRFKLKSFGSAANMPADLVEFRSKFVQEESKETVDAFFKKNKAEALDGLVDLAYVCLGTLYLTGVDQIRLTRHVAKYGLPQIERLSVQGHNCQDTHAQRELIDIVYACRATALAVSFGFDEAWRRVHDANMRKVRAENADGKRKSTWDVVKPEGWKPPVLDDLV